MCIQCHFLFVASVLWHVSLSGECQPSLFLTLTESPLKGDDNQLDRSFSDSSLFNHWGQDLGPESRRVALKMFQYYGYNGYLSDRLSMDRPIPDYRPEGWAPDSPALRLPVCLSFTHCHSECPCELMWLLRAQINVCALSRCPMFISHWNMMVIWWHFDMCPCRFLGWGKQEQCVLKN